MDFIHDCEYTCLYVVYNVILMPVFSIRDISGSSLSISATEVSDSGGCKHLLHFGSLQVSFQICNRMTR
ncbi:hypothetical protein HanPSC8_Chr13g0590551 [Helianthus annuus]|nr:hypothetical protein HanPSC8_Chr13g0590551 [Helianthus annuus]